MSQANVARIIGLFLAAAAGLVLASCAGVTWDSPPSKAQSVNALMKQYSNDDFHIILIHGIRTDDRNTWAAFRQLLCQHLADPCLSPTPAGPLTERLVLAQRAPNANFLGTAVWPTDKEWNGSQPFVDHYVYQLQSGRRLVLDEINWWPLAFAFKCQFIVPSDTALVGPDDDNITNCAKNDETHYPWFSGTIEKALLATHPNSGGAPIVNGSLKTEILDWGISDAVLALGTSKTLLRETVRCAFGDIASFDRRASASTKAGSQSQIESNYACGDEELPVELPQGPSKVQFIIISHSLGAFLMLDTFAAAAADAQFDRHPGDHCRTNTTASLSDLRSTELTTEAARSRNSQALCFILNNSDHLYFFANQFALLELARAQGLSVPSVAPSSGSPACTDALGLWAGCGINPTEKQIVAFSDPGDLLTYQVPKINGATVTNVYTHNSTDWFGIFESPGAAHGNYLTSNSVLNIVFGPVM